MDSESERWLKNLQSDVPLLREAAWEDLSRFAYRVAYLCLCKRGSITESQAWFLAEDAAQEALIDIMRMLPTFSGRSKFTTWVYSFVRLNALEVQRKHDPPTRGLVSLDGDETSSLLEIVSDHIEPEPEMEVEGADLVRASQEVINTRLTERQRRVLLLNAAGYPTEEIAGLLGITCNNIYYLLHVARKKVAQELRAQGYTTNATGDAPEPKKRRASNTNSRSQEL